MTENPRTISPSATLSDAFTLLKSENFRRLPVVEDGSLLGIVTLTDLQKLLSSEPGVLAPIDPAHLVVRDVMTVHPITAKPSDPIEHVALLMSKNRVSSVPILEGGKLVGIITETDLFKAFLRIMGVHERGVRLLLELDPDESGLSEILAIAESYDIMLLSIVTHRTPSRDGQLAVLRVKGIDTELFIDEVRKTKHRVIEVS